MSENPEVYQMGPVLCQAGADVQNCRFDGDLFRVDAGPTAVMHNVSIGPSPLAKELIDALETLFFEFDTEGENYGESHIEKARAVLAKVKR